MAFRLPKGVREYHDMVNNRTDGGVKFKYLFDFYYLCLMLGLDKAKIGPKENLESGEFVDDYPDPYKNVSEIVAGLLIDAEMRRKDIAPQDRTRIENLMLGIIDQFSLTGLNQEGLDLLNRYAVTGFEEIHTNITKTSELETFLVHYYQLFNNQVGA